MKSIILVMMICCSLSVGAQSNPNSAEKNIEKMKIFQKWPGRWEGEGMMIQGQNKSQTSKVVEQVEYRLDETILVVEGIGKVTDPQTKAEKTVHHAFGIVNYDVVTNEYKFQAYLHDGRSTAAWFNVVSENNYRWGFDVPGGKIRYTIVIDPVKKTWNEIGEFSRDETQWFKVFEMNLTKTE